MLCNAFDDFDFIYKIILQMDIFQDNEILQDLTMIGAVAGPHNDWCNDPPINVLGEDKLLHFYYVATIKYVL